MDILFEVSEIFLVTIAVLSAFIAYEFYISKNGKLRVLIIELFLAKIWVYGGAALYYYFGNNVISDGGMRIILNLPMFIIMIRLWKFIRTKK